MGLKNPLAHCARGFFGKGGRPSERLRADRPLTTFTVGLAPFSSMPVLVKEVNQKVPQIRFY